MTTTTALSITRAARVAADLIDYWSGLPAPGSVRATVDWNGERGHHERVQFMFYSTDGRDGFEDLREWAIGMGAVTPGVASWGIGSRAADYVEVHDGIDFLSAEFEREGVVFELATNRRRPVVEG